VRRTRAYRKFRGCREAKQTKEMDYRVGIGKWGSPCEF
jgi:hypothetical protein